MAKVSFTKLGLKLNQEIKEVECNGQIVEVKQYLPIQDKLELISNVINLSADENNFANPVKVSVYTTIEIIDKYTNINFTEKQKEDIPKLYDLLIGNGIVALIINEIPEEEHFDIVNGVSKSIDAVYNYRNSIMGILEAVTTNYDNLNIDIDALQEKINNPESMAFLKDVMTKLN